MSQKSNFSSKGAASLRIARALAQMSPQRPSRAELVAHLHPESDPESSKSRAATQKTLTRMINSGNLKEVIAPNSEIGGLDLPETGLVSASFSLIELNKINSAWEQGGQEHEKPSQVFLAMQLRQRSREWLSERETGPMLSLFVKDIWIVHGSATFDLMIVVLYRETADFLDYIREVVQKLECIESTQTMLITSNLSDD